MNKAIIVARTKEHLMDYAKNHKDEEYVVLNIKDNLRSNKTLKSLEPNIAKPEYKYMLVKSEFVKVSTGAQTLYLKVAQLAENSYAKLLNTPEIEELKDGAIQDGILKGILSLAKDNGLKLTIEDAKRVATNLKAIHSGAGLDSPREELIPKSEEIIDELDKKNVDTEESNVKVMDEAETKTMPEALKEALKKKEEKKEEKKEGNKKEEKEEEKTKSMNEEDTEPKGYDEEKWEKTKSLDDACWEGYQAVGTKKGKDGKDVPNCVPNKTKSVNSKKVKTFDMKAMLKSTNSLSEEEGIFRDMSSAKTFQTMYNTNPTTEGRAVIIPVDISDTRKYGTLAKKKVHII